ncbi:hypothetical protein [Cribrihabitans neustonicus]|uniref:hypothetical protein n=1 Tax=Cribrihabitans neustonicus TaxID=1429085 RepID=UPI003B5CA55C
MTAEELAAKLREGLDLTGEENGITVVSVYAHDVRDRYKVRPPVVGKALRLAGFWRHDESAIWFAIAGAPHVRLFDESPAS